jgi:hypothetical protein
MEKLLTGIIKEEGQVIIPENAGFFVVYSELYAKKVSSDGSEEDYGLVGTKMITNYGLKQLLLALGGHNTWDLTTNSANYALGSWYWVIAYGHTSGTGTTAESATDTGLVTPIQTTPVNPSNYSWLVDTTNGIYRLISVGVLNYTAPATVSEHAVWSRSGANYITNACFDRTVLATPIGVLAGDTITFTYRLSLQRV